MKNQRNVTPPKHNNLPVTDPQDMDIHDLLNKDTKIAVVQKCNELQENTEKQFTEIRKHTSKMKSYQNKLKIIEKNHSEVLEQKNIMSEMKNANREYEQQNGESRRKKIGKFDI